MESVLIGLVRRVWNGDQLRIGNDWGPVAVVRGLRGHQQRYHLPEKSEGRETETERERVSILQRCEFRKRSAHCSGTVTQVKHMHKLKRRK